MLSDEELKQIIGNLKTSVQLIVDKDYDYFIHEYADKQFSKLSIDFFLWLKDYVNTKPQRLVTVPPDSAYSANSLTIIERDEPKCYRVCFDLWIDNSVSDLTLEGNFDFRGKSMQVAYTDLHVL